MLQFVLQPPYPPRRSHYRPRSHRHLHSFKNGLWNSTRQDVVVTDVLGVVVRYEFVVHDDHGRLWFYLDGLVPVASFSVLWQETVVSMSDGFYLYDVLGVSCLSLVAHRVGIAKI